MDSMKKNSYASLAVLNLQKSFEANRKKMVQLSRRIVRDVENKRSLLVFGSGHSGLVPMELYHRAGGASFVLPLVHDAFLPSAGPKLVKTLERASKGANFLLDQVQPQKGEMIWIFSQSGINCASVDLALYAKSLGLYTVGFTSIAHSKSVPSRHPSGKKLFQVCKQVIDLGGRHGDALVDAPGGISVGPFSTLVGTFLAHSILSDALVKLEEKRFRCAYTSVNTPQGEERNQKLEQRASKRDPRLR